MVQVSCFSSDAPKSASPKASADQSYAKDRAKYEEQVCHCLLWQTQSSLSR